MSTRENDFRPWGVGVVETWKDREPRMGPYSRLVRRDWGGGCLAGQLPPRAPRASIGLRWAGGGDPRPMILGLGKRRDESQMSLVL